MLSRVADETNKCGMESTLTIVMCVDVFVATTHSNGNVNNYSNWNVEICLFLSAKLAFATNGPPGWTLNCILF